MEGERGERAKNPWTTVRPTPEEGERDGRAVLGEPCIDLFQEIPRARQTLWR